MSPNPDLKNIRVAIGIVIRTGEILICKRKPRDSFGGYWEFPGGKCEPGESPANCVVRELLEELDIRVAPITQLEPIEHQYPETQVTLYPFICRYETGQAKPLSASELQWVSPTALHEYQFPAANDGLLKQLATPGFIEAIDLAPDRA